MARRSPYLPKEQPPLLGRHHATLVARPQARHQIPEPELDVDDIQGDALLGFNKPSLALLTLEMAGAAAAGLEPLAMTRRWLREWVAPRLTSARDVAQYRAMFRRMRAAHGGDRPAGVGQLCLGVSFSYAALSALTSEEEAGHFYNPASQDVAFRIGLPPRSASLNDPREGIGAMANWKVGSHKNPDILVQIACERAAPIDEEVSSLKRTLRALGDPLTISYLEVGSRRKDLPGHEHFGFLDGISNPGPRGTYTTVGQPEKVYITPRFLQDDDPRSGLYGLPGQRLIWPGEVILGLPKQSDNTTDPDKANLPGPTSFQGPDWAKNGTFLVFRRLRQDVAKFWNFMKRSAEEMRQCPGMSDFTDVHMGAKIIARWPSGAPILRTPSADNPELGAKRVSNNAFQYVTDEEAFRLKPRGRTDGYPVGVPDPAGAVCPLSGHLRKVQPRDASTDLGTAQDTLKRRIIRRGIQYGEPARDVYADDGADRGLLFVCYQASIDRQFEQLIMRWANHDTNPNSGGGHDMVIGQSARPDRQRTFEVPLPGSSTVHTLTTTDEWVIPTGGGYFFVPSISTVKNILGRV